MNGADFSWCEALMYKGFVCIKVFLYLVLFIFRSKKKEGECEACDTRGVVGVENFILRIE